MVEAVVEIVLEKLNSLIQKELGLFLGFDQDMKRIASLLTSIKATLEDAEVKKFSNRDIKHWLGKLKDAARILDDILDECGPSEKILHLGQREELSSSTGDLKHLRYLNLFGDEFETLPKSLCKLWNLQILKLDNCRSLQILPNNLILLKSLQQLSLKDCYKLLSLPPQIGKLPSLRSLTKYIVSKEKGFLLAELGALKLKGDIEIKHLGKVKRVKDVKEANVSIKPLKKLTLSWDKYEEWELQENVEEILEALHPDTQQLQSLRVGGYKGAYFPQWILNPSLMYLRIERCRDVKVLHEALQHMIVLHSLSLYYLRNLEVLPDSLGNLPLLRELAIGFCSNESTTP